MRLGEMMERRPCSLFVFLPPCLAFSKTKDENDKNSPSRIGCEGEAVIWIESIRAFFVLSWCVLADGSVFETGVVVTRLSFVSLFFSGQRVCVWV